MANKFESILAELDRRQNFCDKDVFIEQKSINLIAAYQNLKTYIQENYNSEDSQDILGRLIRAIDQNDVDKVVRKLQQVKIDEAKLIKGKKKC
jgi:hypothetical protein